MTTATRRQPRRNLTEQVTDSLRERIAGGTWRAGEKLPTEQQLVEEFGVSRTVVREAVAALRADRLIEARQGVGVFVLDQPKSPSALDIFREIPQKLSSVIEMLELRAAVEIEAAGLAAIRCSPAQEVRIRECFDEMAAEIAAGRTAEEADFAFHAAIARATANGQFMEFLNYLGRRTIPRSQLQRNATSNADRELLLDRERRLLEEHRAILEAIRLRDADAAREAMRAHLRGSLERYRGLMPVS